MNSYANFPFFSIWVRVGCLPTECDAYLMSVMPTYLSVKTCKKPIKVAFSYLLSSAKIGFNKTDLVRDPYTCHNLCLPLQPSVRY